MAKQVKQGRGASARVAKSEEEGAVDLALHAPEESLFSDTDVDDDDLPDHVRKMFELNDFAQQRDAALDVYVYRHEDGRTSSPKAAVGVLKGLREVPTAHDIGEKFRRAGCYSGVVRVRWIEEGGRVKEVMRALPVSYVGPEYESLPAKAEVAAPSSMDLLGADFQRFQLLMQAFTDMAVKLRGEAPKAEPVDVQVLRESFAAQLREADSRIRRLTSMLDEADARARKVDDRQSKAAGDGGFNLDNVDKLAEGAGSVLRAVKTGLELFKDVDAPAAGAES